MMYDGSNVKMDPRGPTFYCTSGPKIAFFHCGNRVWTRPNAFSSVDRVQMHDSLQDMSEPARPRAGASVREVTRSCPGPSTEGPGQAAAGAGLARGSPQRKHPTAALEPPATPTGSASAKSSKRLQKVLPAAPAAGGPWLPSPKL